jgi:5-methylcytosine-specific restriction protein A
MPLKTLKPRLATLDTRRVSTFTLHQQRGLSTARWQRTRARILTRDNGVCVCEDCRQAGRLRAAHEVDHIVPVWAGGSEDDSNLQSINRECHNLKTAREAKRRAGGM